MTDLPTPPFAPPPLGKTPARPSLVRNTAFNAGASLVGLVVGLVLSPILLVVLGLERFGLLSLLWAITGSLGLLDLRFASALTPLAASALARQERDRVARLASTGLAFYAALGLVEVGLALIWVRIPGLVAWIPEPLREEGRFALVAAVAVFALNALTSVFIGLLHALQRFDLAANIAMALTIFRGTLLVAVGWSGGGLRGLLLAEGVVACIQLLVTGRAMRRLLADFRLLRAPDASSVRELAVFGGKLQIAHAAHLVSLHADKLLLSAFLGLAAVAYYDLGSKIAFLMRGLPLLLISATLPAASTMEASGDRPRLWGFYLAGTRMLVFAATPLLIFTLTGAGAILLAWAGITALEARQVVWLLALGYYVSLLSGMANSVSVGMGKPELEMRRSLIAGSLNLGLSTALIWLIGFPGAPLGTALALAVGSWYLVRALHAEFGRPFSAVLGLFGRPGLAALPAGAGALLLLSLADGGRAAALVGLAGSGLLIAAVYSWLGVREGLLRRDWLRSLSAQLRAPRAEP